MCEQAQFKCASNFYWASQQKVEGCKVPISWTFFESCHGKCYCDPEGGALKNAASRHELNINDPKEQLRGSECFFRWASEKSGLAKPRLTLEQKKGRGIFRRFFYWIPSKGLGAVDRSRLPKMKAVGTSKLHQFVDIGVCGVLSTRRGACNRCSSCWDADPHNCKYIEFVGQPFELPITRETVPTAAAERMDRAQLDRQAIELAKSAKRGCVICVETHKDEQNHPWVLAEVIDEVQLAQTPSPPHDPEKDPIHFDSIRVNDFVLNVRLFAALEPGSSTYFPSEITLLVPARRVRVINVEMEETRSSSRLASRRQYKIELKSLETIRSEMPCIDDNFEVERVLQYRCIYSTEQWLIEWKNYSTDRNSWQPWENLLTEKVREEACTVREATLPKSKDGINKFNVVTLKAVLKNRGLDDSGSKAALVDRVLSVL